MTFVSICYALFCIFLWVSYIVDNLTLSLLEIWRTLLKTWFKLWESHAMKCYWLWLSLEHCHIISQSPRELRSGKDKLFSIFSYFWPILGEPRTEKSELCYTGLECFEIESTPPRLCASCGMHCAIYWLLFAQWICATPPLVSSDFFLKSLQIVWGIKCKTNGKSHVNLNSIKIRSQLM